MSFLKIYFLYGHIQISEIMFINILLFSIFSDLECTDSIPTADIHSEQPKTIISIIKFNIVLTYKFILLFRYLIRKIYNSQVNS